jgi:hypothetical protein
VSCTGAAVGCHSLLGTLGQGGEYDWDMDEAERPGGVAAVNGLLGRGQVAVRELRRRRAS